MPEDEMLGYSIDFEAAIEYKRYLVFDSYRRPGCYAGQSQTE